MPKALLTYVRTFEVDLDDPDFRSLLEDTMRGQGVEGAASLDEISAALKELLLTDPDALVPSLDDDFDASNFAISVPSEMAAAPNHIVVEAPPEEEAPVEV